MTLARLGEVREEFKLLRRALDQQGLAPLCQHEGSRCLILVHRAPLAQGGAAYLPRPNDQASACKTGHTQSPVSFQGAIHHRPRTAHARKAAQRSESNDASSYALSM
jgi:hypothetical protein